jgi:hypothetical protein
MSVRLCADPLRVRIERIGRQQEPGLALIRLTFDGGQKRAQLGGVGAPCTFAGEHPEV